MRLFCWFDTTLYNKRVNKAILFILVGIIIGAVAVSFFNHTPQISKPVPTLPIGNSSPTPVASISAQASDWQMYTDATYGFIIKYPKEVKLQKTFDHDYHLTPDWRQELSASEAALGQPVVALVVYRTKSDNSYPRFFSAEARIGISTNKTEVANCITGNTDTKIINGIPLAVFPIQDSGTLQYTKGISFRVVHNNTCYALEQLKGGSSYHDTKSSQDLSDTELDNYYDTVGKILQTFQFSK